MHNLAVVIPAVKKNVAFPDDLVKKLDGVTMIQRAINTAIALVPREHVYVVTDSQEIRLICERNDVRVQYQKDLRLQGSDIIRCLRSFLLEWYRGYRCVMVLYPYAPTMTADILKNAYEEFKRGRSHVMMSVKEEHRRVFREGKFKLLELMDDHEHEAVMVEARAFLLFRSSLIKTTPELLTVQRFELPRDVVEVRSYQDWWICERLLKRRRIVFRVIGNQAVGMGHIFRSLALAHEITDHEVVFVCDEGDALAVNKIAGHDYLVDAGPEKDLVRRILSYRPDLVVNDMLNTTAAYIRALRQGNCCIMNFEDIGTGAVHSDLTINELYETPMCESEKILWGNRYLFLRDEFISARPRSFRQRVENLLITFGGVDPSDLSLRTLKALEKSPGLQNIRIYLVVGDGYRNLEQLCRFKSTHADLALEIVQAAGEMSKLMESADLAICSNGRTVYELAHMRVPTIVLAQHDRELTHNFACEENGFIPLGLWSEKVTARRLLKAFERLIDEPDQRRSLHERMKRFDFLRNKSRVVSLIENLLQGKGMS